MTTIDNLMKLAYKLRDAKTYEWDVSDAVAADKALRAALTEALAQPIQTLGCTSNCENCTYAHGSPAHAGHCYVFYDEPQGVCAKWKDANPNPTVLGCVQHDCAECKARAAQIDPESEILARGRFHAFKGENGEPDDWEWFESGTNCEDGCIDAVIVRADYFKAAQPAREPAKTFGGCPSCGKTSCVARSCTQPALEPLTPEQIREWWASENGLEDCDMCDVYDFTRVVRAVEKKHGIGSDK